MSLARFIVSNMKSILQQWDEFASSLFPSGAKIPHRALRDHAEAILMAIVLDIQTHQSKAEQSAKSKGHAPKGIGSPETAAETHAVLRAQDGLDINQLAAEYRALRASVLRLWSESAGEYTAADLEEMVRFNEAIDQSLAESIDFFHRHVERSRNLLLGTLGHDMRNPLNAILLVAQELNMMKAGEEVTEASECLMRSGASIQNLLNDLVDYNRITLAVGMVINPVPTDLSAVLSDEVKQLQIAYPHHTIQLDITGNVCGVWDGPRLQQVLRNLVSNACAYGVNEEPVEINLFETEDGVCFEVINLGTTIDPQTLEKLFCPLVRGKNHEENANEKGLGLGLYIVREITMAHGGEVTVKSKNGFTTFSVYLPLINEAGRWPTLDKGRSQSRASVPCGTSL